MLGSSLARMLGCLDAWMLGCLDLTIMLEHLVGRKCICISVTVELDYYSSGEILSAAATTF